MPQSFLPPLDILALQQPRCQVHLQGEMKKGFAEKPSRLQVNTEIYEDSDSNCSPVMPDYVAPTVRRSSNFYSGRMEVASTASTDAEEEVFDVFDFMSVAPPPGLSPATPSLLSTQPMPSFWDDLEKFTPRPLGPAAWHQGSIRI